MHYLIVRARAETCGAFGGNWTRRRGDAMRAAVRHQLDPSIRSNDTRDFHASLRAKIVGQEEGVQSLVDMYQVFCAGLNSPGRPVGNLLFLGPTGSGKTRIVEAVYFPALDLGRRQNHEKEAGGKGLHPADQQARLWLGSKSGAHSGGSGAPQIFSRVHEPPGQSGGISSVAA